MKKVLVGLGGLFVTLVLTPLLASWLTALGTELQWFDSPSNQIQSILKQISSLRALLLYDIVVVALTSAAVGYGLHWMVKRKSVLPNIPTTSKLVVSADAIEASRRIGLALEAIGKATNIVSQGGAIEDELTYVTGQITATSQSLSALGVHLPILNREHPMVYLQSYRSLFQAIKPVIEAGQIQTAAEVASGLEDRLPEHYLYRPTYGSNDTPKLRQ